MCHLKLLTFSSLNTKELLSKCHVFQATKLQWSPAVKVRCGFSFIKGNTKYMFWVSFWVSMLGPGHTTKGVGPSQHNTSPIILVKIISISLCPHPSHPRRPCYSVLLLPPVWRPCSKLKKKRLNCELPTKLLKSLFCFILWSCLISPRQKSEPSTGALKKSAWCPSVCSILPYQQLWAAALMAVTDSSVVSNQPAPNLMEMNQGMDHSQ